MEVEAGKFYRVDYSSNEPNFIIGKLEKTDGHFSYWEAPRFSQWKGYKSAENSLWTITSPETSIREATEDDMKLFNDYVINGKTQVFEQQYLFRKKGSTIWQGVTEFMTDSFVVNEELEYRALEFTKREAE